ncbi:calpain [Metarhizium album ARSEF 1941]|uniref:Calpain n=1 Tax=Metarhizium album (strain ARSEF 1941) TaxID=1081103 RepID=A0A0B2X101_METAS|nr:calpain [Metarhizium album ARSEF 1941]KHN99554.1 calpain [Metarhizium album ARSEF 1941]
MGTSQVSLPPSLEDARIHGLPSAAYYIPNFIDEGEEHFILGKIAGAPKPRWKQLTRRRLQTWPSDLLQDRLLDSPLPAWLENPVVSRILSLSAVKSAPGSKTDTEPETEHIFAQSPHQRPNHVLINEYAPGVGIMARKLSN